MASGKGGALALLFSPYVLVERNCAIQSAGHSHGVSTLAMRSVRQRDRGPSLDDIDDGPLAFGISGRRRLVSKARDATVSPP